MRSHIFPQQRPQDGTVIVAHLGECVQQNDFLGVAGFLRRGQHGVDAYEVVGRNSESLGNLLNAVHGGLPVASKVAGNRTGGQAR